ncbi:MAG: hypothetical protein JXL84_11365 [Deltaproteobacteria bacterium]|nr:hypothetical protein [Deltaproteobacteria bacterium]
MTNTSDLRKEGFSFLATGIGSVPTLDVGRTCLDILAHLPQMPFWPQFPRRAHLEDMTLQFTGGLPLIEVDEQGRRPVLSSGERASELALFYEHFLAEDEEHFALSRQYAPGLHELIALVREEPARYGPYLKGQTIGPVTFCMAVLDHEGKAIIHDPEMVEAISRGLAIKALWQARQLAACGKEPFLFLDEPSLTGFGSAFSSIQRDEVIRLLREFMGYLRERCPVRIGIHCCGNTDWSMITEARPDIISFDAFSYMDYFLLYREEILQFLRRGGSIAWGIVPTGEEIHHASPEDLLRKLTQGLDRLIEWGLDRDTVRQHSLLTPACGMGGMEEASAASALDLLRDLSGTCTREW